jgi:hypothetical protein
VSLPSHRYSHDRHVGMIAEIKKLKHEVVFERHDFHTKFNTYLSPARRLFGEEARSIIS